MDSYRPSPRSRRLSRRLVAASYSDHGQLVRGGEGAPLGWDDRGPSGRAARRPAGVSWMSELVMVTVC